MRLATAMDKLLKKHTGFIKDKVTIFKSLKLTIILTVKNFPLFNFYALDIHVSLDAFLSELISLANAYTTKENVFPQSALDIKSSVRYKLSFQCLFTSFSVSHHFPLKCYDGNTVHVYMHNAYDQWNPKLLNLTGKLTSAFVKKTKTVFWAAAGIGFRLYTVVSKELYESTSSTCLYRGEILDATPAKPSNDVARLFHFDRGEKESCCRLRFNYWLLIQWLHVSGIYLFCMG